MPAITIPSPVKQGSAYRPSTPAAADRSAPAYFDHKPARSRSSSPERPPVSPITPVTSHAELPALSEEYAAAPAPSSRPRAPLPPTEFIAAPKPQPIKEWHENEDVLALRSAISLLQMQREKAKKDIRALEQVKQQAVSDPDGFLQEMKARKAKPPEPKKTLADILGAADAEMLAPTLSSDDDEDEAAQADTKPMEGVATDSSSTTTTQDQAAPAAAAAPPQPSKFQAPPGPQNVVRCPPINWAKYHVVGDTLEKMHAEQVARPNSDGSLSAAKAPPHQIAAPYNPFTDKTPRLGDPHAAHLKKSTKKPNP
jgi:hypothetical protein